MKATSTAFTYKLPIAYRLDVGYKKKGLEQLEKWSCHFLEHRGSIRILGGVLRNWFKVF